MFGGLVQLCCLCSVVAVDQIGRPWTRPFFIGLAGGSASGKSTVVDRIVERLGSPPSVATIRQDSFYRAFSASEHELAEAGSFNFDHPTAFDFDLMLQVMEKLYSDSKHPVAIPRYDFKTHSRMSSKHDVYLAPRPQVVIFEGLFSLYDERLRKFFDLKLFVDVDGETRLARRIRRDIQDRGRDLSSILQQYETYVKPSFELFVQPTKRYADIVIPGGAENAVAIELLAQHTATLLEQRGLAMGACRNEGERGTSAATSSAAGGEPATLARLRYEQDNRAAVASTMP